MWRYVHSPHENQISGWNLEVEMVMRSALPAMLLVDDTFAYFLIIDCEGGIPVLAPGVGGIV